MGVKVYDGMKVNEFNQILLPNDTSSNTNNTNNVFAFIYNILAFMPILDMIIYFCLFIFTMKWFYSFVLSSFKMVLRIVLIAIFIITMIMILQMTCMNNNSNNNNDNNNILFDNDGNAYDNNDNNSDDNNNNICTHINYQLQSSMFASKLLLFTNNTIIITTIQTNLNMLSTMKTMYFKMLELMPRSSSSPKDNTNTKEDD